MTDEIFGPILPVLSVADVDAAIDYVNRRPKPLALYVFSNTPGPRSGALQTSSGGVSVNTDALAHREPAAPVRRRRRERHGRLPRAPRFETFTHRKSVLTRGTRFDPKLMYPPYTRLKKALLKRFV